MTLRGEIGQVVERGSTILILGFGRSGRSAFELLDASGRDCRVADRRPPTGDDRRRIREADWVSDEDPAALDGVGLVIKSPGVVPEHPLVARARGRGIRVVGELDLGWAAAHAPLHSITGSNGKSTTTSLLAHLLATAGVEAAAAGNIGEPLTAVAPQIGSKGAIAVEVSSFQIEDLSEYRSRSAVLLNVSPDHLDRHGTLERYFEIKARLCDLVEEDGFRIFNADDPLQQRIVSESRARDPERTLVFSARPIEGRGAHLDGDDLVLRLDRPTVFARVRELTLSGPHNVQNALAASLTAIIAGAKPEDLGAGLRTFRPLRHRLERVGRAGDVLFVNDSKATNLDAMRMALHSFRGGVVLIAGGRDKDSPFEELRAVVSDRVRHLVLIGEAAAKMRAAWPSVPTSLAVSMDEAVRIAHEKAQPKGVVLLAPGCASFDMFENFIDRGDRFCDAVRQICRGREDA